MKPMPRSCPSLCLLLALACGLAAGNAQAQATEPCFNAAPANADLATASPEVSDLTAGPDTSDLADQPLSAGSRELQRLQAELQQENPLPLTGDFSRDFTREMTRQLERAARTATVAACRGETPELRRLAQKIVNAELELKAELRRLQERERRKP